jgi:hypothetical protein
MAFGEARTDEDGVTAMRMSGDWMRRGLVAVAMFGMLGGVGRPQKQSTTNTQTPTASNPLPGLGPELPPGLKEKQEKAQNDERQKRLVADTDKLLELATQLHTDVAKTDKNMLSIDVIKRADEIEKLAHAVKERMRG